MRGDNPRISVTPATPGDIPAILDLIRKLAEYERLSHQVVATEDLLHEHLFGPRPAADALIGQLDSRTVGFALFYQTFSTFLARPGIWLEDLFVLSESRGAGVGSALLRQVAAIAIARNCGRLEWSVLDWNEPALGFYRKLGAVPMNDWTIQRVTSDALNKLAGRTMSC